MEALGGRYADVWRGIGAAMDRPRAILMVSAHWFMDGSQVTAMAQPRTIHDFYGFPEALYSLRYPAPGDPDLAAGIARILAPLSVAQDYAWGLDHGAWSVLLHLFPEADIPVVQLSIDRTKPGQFHFDVGRRLRGLRDEGVLIVGSGNIVHNLHAAVRSSQAPPADWATRFNASARTALAQGRWDELVNYEGLGPDARRSIPTPEHYLPLLYVLGAAFEGETASFFNDDIAFSSISMLGVALGLDVVAVGD